MKNFLLMVLDNALRLVLWGLSLAAFIIAVLLLVQHQVGGAALALAAGALCAAFSGYRQLSGWSAWNWFRTHPSDELSGMPNEPLDDTPYRND